MQSQRYRSVDEYIATFPDDVQAILQSLRATIRSAAPEAEERISYQMPAFALHGDLVYYAARKSHIGFYPTGSGVEAFARDLSGYTCTKGAIRFPISEPLPMDLIRRIVEFRCAENLTRADVKAGKTGSQRARTAR